MHLDKLLPSADRKPHAGTGPRCKRRLAVLPLLLVGCELAEVPTEPVEDLILAGVMAVLTVDPLHPSRVDIRAGALITRFHRQMEYELPSATVQIVGESGRVLRLAEVSDPLATCVTQLVSGNRPTAGSCYLASAREALFAPGERLTLTVDLSDGGILTGKSRMPGLFAPSQLSLKDGRCRLDPNTGHRFAWARSEGSWGYVAEARFAGLGGLWTSNYPLYLDINLRGADETEIHFPRSFLFNVSDPGQGDLYRVLREGLPPGASAEIAVGAIDRNWANWIRLGRIEQGGEVRIPSVFGDGTGWFGTAVRWKVGVEAREANGDGDLPPCGRAAAD